MRLTSQDIDSKLYTLLREHPALIVSAFYVGASFVGMFWSWAFLRRFGINFFNYAQVSDFLLASLKEPFTWLLVVLAVLMVNADNAYSRRVERQGNSRWFGWYGSPTYRKINYAGAVALVSAFIFVYATIEAENLRDQGGDMVEVTFEFGEPAESATLLGTTSQFVFLYDLENDRVDIHPFENVHAISFRSP